VKLVVLGSSVTALAVIRDACRLNIETILVDFDDGIALSSNCARKHLISDVSETLPLLKNICSGGASSTWLIATSDMWLQYIVGNRAKLELLFSNILHPDNENLKTCLDKDLFIKHCNSIGLRTPQIVEHSSVRAGSEEIDYPLFLRPLAIPKGLCRKIIPKAVEVNNYKEALRSGSLCLNSIFCF